MLEAIQYNIWWDSVKQCTPIVLRKRLRRTRASHLSNCSTSKRLWHEFSKRNLYVALTLPRWHFYNALRIHISCSLCDTQYLLRVAGAFRTGIAWFLIQIYPKPEVETNIKTRIWHEILLCRKSWEISYNRQDTLLKVKKNYLEVVKHPIDSQEKLPCSSQDTLPKVKRNYHTEAKHPAES